MASVSSDAWDNRAASVPTYRVMSPPASGAVANSTRSPWATSRMPRSRRLTSRSPSRASTTSRSTPASVPISRRESGRSATNRRASSPASDSSPGVDAASPGCPAQSPGAARSSVGIRSSGGIIERPPDHDRAPRLRLLRNDLAPLHQLEHRQEGDRNQDPIPKARQQVLKDKLIRAGQRRPDHVGTLLHRDHAWISLRHLLGGWQDDRQPLETGYQDGRFDGTCRRRDGTSASGRLGRPRLAPEHPTGVFGLRLKRSSGVAERAVQEKPGSQLCLRIFS